MKLTLSVSGGFTGLTKEHTVDTGALDEKTLHSLMNYFKKPQPSDTGMNLSESWTLNDEKEVRIRQHELTPELEELYNKMKNSLQYKKK